MKKVQEFKKDTYKKLPDLITVGQAADLIGVHPNTIRRWAKESRIHSTRVGSRKDRRFDKNELLKETLNIKVIDGKKEAYTKYYKYLKDLFKKAIKKNPVQSLYAVLNVTGMHYGHWDPTEELYDFFDDFNELLEEATKNQNNLKRQYRIALVMYCHVLEMSLPWQIIANILLVINGKEYRIDPFFELRRKRKSILGYIPPSANQKVKHLKELAVTSKETQLIKYIQVFYNEKVRNAFYHSDYCLTNLEFRYTDNGIWSSLSLDDLDSIITKCFAFYEAFFHAHAWAKVFFKESKTYHKWPNYEVFEILKNDKEIYGFKVHFSNGQVAKFSREPEKVEAINLHFEKDGTINFFAGNLDKLKPIWLVDGKPFKENKN